MKLGRNDKCYCKSGKKYKKCCILKDEAKKSQDTKNMNDGHELSSEIVKLCHEGLGDYFNDHKIIDISNLITEDNYKKYQTLHYYSKIIMILERNEKNNGVFTKRAPEDVDIMVLYRGSYKCFIHSNFDLVFEDVVKMIEDRMVEIN